MARSGATSGDGDKVAGAVKEGLGKLTGDRRLEAEGRTDRAKGEAKNAVRDVKDAAKGVADSLRRG